jgi:hypothetical protein
MSLQWPLEPAAQFEHKNLVYSGLVVVAVVTVVVDNVLP